MQLDTNYEKYTEHSQWIELFTTFAPVALTINSLTREKQPSGFVLKRVTLKKAHFAT